MHQHITGEPASETICRSADMKTRPLPDLEAAEPGVSRISMSANILSTLLLRISSRVSFVLLGFYLGEHFSSATAVALVLEAFYITELFLSPIAGSLTDRIGRKPFLFLAPLIGAAAAIFFMVASYFFPRPNGHIDPALLALLALILLGRLLEGCATAINTPASLGYITDTTSHSAKLRARVMTAFEVATVGGLALAIPLGGRISSLFGTAGFVFVIALYLLNALLIATLVEESPQRLTSAQKHGSLLESLKLLKSKRISTFLPAWLCINTLVGAWITLITITLAYPKAQAILRHPHQLLYGGFSKDGATLLLGGFGLLFLLGMGLWLLVLSRLRRSTIMLIGLAGLALSIVGLTIINSLAQSIPELNASANTTLLLLVSLVILGIMLLSGFTPTSLTQMAAIAETQPGKRGAVMGLYSVVMGIGQLLGASIGGLSVDLGGFYGLMIFSTALCLISLVSVLYMRNQGFDRDSALLTATNKLPALASKAG
jgi:MFS family permease